MVFSIQYTSKFPNVFFVKRNMKGKPQTYTMIMYEEKMNGEPKKERR